NRLPLLGLPQQIVNQNLGVDLLLDVERRGVDDEVAPVLFILPAPNELGVEITVAALVGNTNGMLLLLLNDRLKFRGRDVFPLVGVVDERFDGLGPGGFLGHAQIPWATACLVTDASILLNSLWTLALKSAWIW